MENPKNDRTEYHSTYYQQNQEKMRQRRKENYQQKKEKEQRELDNYYSAHSIQVLLTFKQYTELSKQTKKLWLDLSFTLRELNHGINSIEEIMRLRELADNLINDYWERAKSKERKESESWNVLTPEEKKKLIKFWGREEARGKKKLATALTELEQEGESYEKDIELAKFHEERGKVKCDCWQCQEEKKIKGEIRAELREKEPKEKIECGECGKFVSLSAWNEEAGACKPCVKRLNG